MERFLTCCFRRPVWVLVFVLYFQTPTLQIGLAASFFSEVTPTAVPAGIGNNKVAFGDVNNDGWVDFHAGEKIFLNQPHHVAGRRFTPLAGTVDAGGLFGDYDNDGDLDFFSYHTGAMFKNQSGTSFHQVTIPGLSSHQDLPVVSRSATWSDHDNDGDIDLHIGGFENASSSIFYADARYDNNQGNSFSGTWTQTTDAVITPNNPRPARGVTAADFDRDGDSDIYVSNYRLEPNQLWVNNGAGNFTEQAATRGVLGGAAHGHWAHTIGSAWGDFDNDGEIDLFAGNFAHPAGFSGPLRQPESRFYRNRGSGNPNPDDNYTFEDLGQLGLSYQETYSSPVLGDYDNDGDLDLFFTTINTTPPGSNDEFAVLFRNDGNWNFSADTEAANLTGLQNTNQAGFADYDNDGDLDLIASGRLFQNQGNSNSWLKVKMVGDGHFVSRDAVGAQLRIHSGNQTFTRQVEFGTGEGNQNDPTVHFGLGQISGPVDLEILWPGGATQTVQDVAINQTQTVGFAPTPRELPNVDSANITLHFAAETLSLNDGDLVSVWPASTGLDATTESYQRTPNFVAGWSPSGLPGVKFDGANDRLLIGLGSDTGISADAIFAVLKMDATGAGAQQFVLGGDTGGTGEKVMGVRNGDLFVHDESIVRPGTNFTDTTSLHVVSWVRGEPIRIDGVATNDDFVWDLDFSNISLIGDERLVPDNPGPNMTFGELITYQGLGSLMKTADRDAIENYLMTKWTVVPDTTWGIDSSGLWNDSSMWKRGIAPVTRQATAKFSDTISAPTSIIVDTNVTVNEIILDHSVKYAIVGAGSVSLQATTGSTLPLISVAQGDHEFQVVTNLEDDTTADVASGSSLSFNNALNLNGNMLTKTGEGALWINNVLDTGGGTVSALDGTIVGSGMVLGNVINQASTIAPGSHLTAVPEPSTAMLSAATIILVVSFWRWFFGNGHMIRVAHPRISIDLGPAESRLGS